MALWARRRSGADLTDLVHHSDRRVQYRAIRYTRRRRRRRIRRQQGRLLRQCDGRGAELSVQGRAHPQPRESNSPAPCSSGSRAGTTPAAATPASGCCHPTSSKPFTPPPSPRHDSTNNNCPGNRVRLQGPHKDLKPTNRVSTNPGAIQTAPPTMLQTTTSTNHDASQTNRVALSPESALTRLLQYVITVPSAVVYIPKWGSVFPSLAQVAITVVTEYSGPHR